MLNKYFLTFFIGLLTITLIGLVASPVLRMLVEEFGNCFKCIGCLGCLFLWGTVYNKFDIKVIVSFAWFNGLIAILASIHFYRVFYFNEGGGFLFNTIYHYAVIILAFGQYYLIRNAREKT